MTAAALKALVTVTTLLLVGCASGSDRAADDPQRVIDAWARPGASRTTSAVYLTITNGDSADLALTGVSSPLAGAGEIHESMDHDGMMHMTPRPTVPILAGETLTMRPGGVHVMLIDLNRTLLAGDSVPLRVTFSNGVTRSITAPVRAP